jgi:hypothetical protein
MSYKTEGRYRVEVIADSSGKWCGNAIRFDTVDEGKAYGADLASRWTLVRAWRVVDGDEDQVVHAEKWA